jgi:hypothetical protein
MKLTVIIILAAIAALILFIKNYFNKNVEVKILPKRNGIFDQEDDYFHVKVMIKKAKTLKDLERCATAIWIYQGKYTGYIAQQCTTRLCNYYEQKEKQLSKNIPLAILN